MPELQQLPLHFTVPEHHRFDDFLPGENADILQIMRQFEQSVANLSTNGFFLAGNRSAGKTHLLLALCQEHAQSARYIPLRRISPDQIVPLLNVVRDCRIICFDDVDVVLGQHAVELALFDAFNHMHDQGGYMVFSSQQPVQMLSFVLPDLKSRLHSLTQLYLKPLKDQDRKLILQQHAQRYGWVLEDSVAEYMLRHQHRDLQRLVAMIKQVDHASLAAQRRVTIPFLRQLLAQNE